MTLREIRRNFDHLHHLRAQRLGLRVRTARGLAPRAVLITEPAKNLPDPSQRFGTHPSGGSHATTNRSHRTSK